MKNDNLEWAKVVAISLDNTNVNMGDKNSLKNRILEENPEVFVAGCKCHLAHIPDWKVCIVQPRSRLRNFGTKRASRRADLGKCFSDSQTRILVKRECEMLLRNLESAPNAHHSLTKRATGGKERKNTKPMKHDTKNVCRMCLRGLDALNLRV